MTEYLTQTVSGELWQFLLTFVAIFGAGFFFAHMVRQK